LVTTRNQPWRETVPSLLEEKDAIRELMANYCFRCDTRDPEGLGALFTEDSIWDGGDWGIKRGPGELKEFLMQATGDFAMRHVCANEVIMVEGDTATAQCYFFVLKCGDGAPEIFFTGFYDDRFIKRDGKWLFKERITRKN
jgi:hypothetical protein